MAAPARLLIVAGDIVVDHHLYQGERTTPHQRDRRGVRHVRRSGGAAGLRDLIRALLSANIERFQRYTDLDAKQQAAAMPASNSATRHSNPAGIWMRSATTTCSCSRGQTPSPAARCGTDWRRRA